MSRSCQRCFLATVEEGWKEEAQKERGREEEEEEKESRERQVRYEIVQKVVLDIEKKARAQVDVKPTAQRTCGQSVKQSWDCSQIENEEEDEEELWQKENQMELQWAEDEKLEESSEQRRMEGTRAKGSCA